MTTIDTNGKATISKCSPYDGGKFVCACPIAVKDGEDINSDSFKRMVKQPAIDMMIEKWNPDHFIETILDPIGKTILRIDGYKNHSYIRKNNESITNA